MLYMFKLLLTALVVIQSSLYSLQFTTASGSTVSMSAYQGKKLLLVNIATESERVGQLTQLQQLQQQYADSLVVLAFPSNSFGKEPRTDSAILSFCAGGYSTTFPIASKASVSGADIQPVYSWLTQGVQNGLADGAVQGDFQKFLISSSGEIIGVFAPKVSPLDTTITHAIMRDL